MYVIVVGNEKGGSGKSTVAMHLIVAFLRLGARVGSLDLDGRQGSLSLYVEHRAAHAEARGLALPMPRHERLTGTGDVPGDEAALAAAVARLRPDSDVLIIDTPGSDTPLSRAGHALADILITPINDSFIDLAALARIDRETLRIDAPSHYAEMVWEAKKRRALRDRGSISWGVLRNRVGHVDSRNRREMERLLGDLSNRIGFAVVPGLSERVIFRELFLKGLTLSDLRDDAIDVRMSLSHVAARQELRHLMDAIGAPRIAAALGLPLAGVTAP